VTTPTPERQVLHDEDRDAYHALGDCDVCAARRKDVLDHLRTQATRRAARRPA
jgi:hypothetical protein